MSTITDELIPRPEDRSNGRRFALWFGVLGPIIAWAAQLGISWGLVPYSCDRGNVIWLHINTIVFAVVAIVAFFTAMNTYRSLGTVPPAPDRSRALDTDHFMSILGMLSSGLFLALILLEGSAVFFLEPCGVQ